MAQLLYYIGKQLVTFLMCIICGKGYTRYLIFLIWKEGGYVSVGYKFGSKKFLLFQNTASCFLSLLKNCEIFFSLYKFGVLNEARCYKQSYFSFNLITRLPAPLCSIDILTSVWLTVVLTWFCIMRPARLLLVHWLSFTVSGTTQQSGIIDVTRGWAFSVIRWFPHASDVADRRMGTSQDRERDENNQFVVVVR